MAQRKKRKLNPPDNSTGMSSSPFSGVKAPVDPNTGQRTAFPGLEDDDELFYGPAKDGLDYLRMVRSQAKLVPSLLTAKKTETGDHYEAVSQREETSKTAVYSLDYDEPEDFDAADVEDDGEEDYETESQASSLVRKAAYHDALLRRFQLLRNALSKLPAQNSENSKINWFQWRYKMLHERPTMTQISSISPFTALGILHIMMDKHVKKGKIVGPSLGVWIWVLLGRLLDVGEMHSETVALMRDIGKWALQRRKMEETGTREEQYEGYDEAEDEYQGSEDEYQGSEDEETRQMESDMTENANTVSKGGQTGSVKETPKELGVADGRQTSAEESAVIDDEPAAKQLSPVENEVDDEPDEAALEAARNLLLNKISGTSDRASTATNGENIGKAEEAEPCESTRMILDLIVLVVGRLYGQRDLLLENFF